nr:hypothetical protein Iba_chr12fCG9180 [Ipomoea batatas]
MKESSSLGCTSLLTLLPPSPLSLFLNNEERKSTDNYWSLNLRTQKRRKEGLVIIARETEECDEGWVESQKYGNLLDTESGHQLCLKANGSYWAALFSIAIEYTEFCEKEEFATGVTPSFLMCWGGNGFVITIPLINPSRQMLQPFRHLRYSSWLKPFRLQHRDFLLRTFPPPSVASLPKKNERALSREVKWKSGLKWISKQLSPKVKEATEEAVIVATLVIVRIRNLP